MYNERIDFEKILHEALSQKLFFDSMPLDILIETLRLMSKEDYKELSDGIYRKIKDKMDDENFLSF